MYMYICIHKLTLYIVLQVTQPIQVSVGGATLSCSLQSDWPKSLWRCPLPDDAIPSNEGDVPVSVNYNDLKEELTISAGIT